MAPTKSSALARPAEPPQLLRIEEIARQLAECFSLDEVKDVRDKAQAISIYHRERGASLEIQNNAAEVRLRAERRLGELLKDMPKAQGTRGQLSGRDASGAPKTEGPENATQTLEDIGITYKQSSVWQQIADMPEEVFENRIAEAKENDLELTTTRVLRGGREEARQAKRERLAKVAPVKGEAHSFRVIYADPAWEYGDTRNLDGYAGSAAEDHYPTMTVEELCSLKVTLAAGDEIPVGDLALDDAVLFCWATFPLLPDALTVTKAWGFAFKTAFVWAKDRANFGHYHNASAELLLVCTRGSCTPDTDHREDQVQRIKRTGKHSEKPEEFRALIERLYLHGKRIELFRRGAAPKGWTVWGNEAKDDGA